MVVARDEFDIRVVALRMLRGHRIHNLGIWSADLGLEATKEGAQVAVLEQAHAIRQKLFLHLGGGALGAQPLDRRPHKVAETSELGRAEAAVQLVAAGCLAKVLQRLAARGHRRLQRGDDKRSKVERADPSGCGPLFRLGVRDWRPLEDVTRRIQLVLGGRLVHEDFLTGGHVDDKVILVIQEAPVPARLRRRQKMGRSRLAEWRWQSDGTMRSRQMDRGVGKELARAALARSLCGCGAAHAHHLRASTACFFGDLFIHTHVVLMLVNDNLLPPAAPLPSRRVRA
jgi:hypothetical protein